MIARFLKLSLKYISSRFRCSPDVTGVIHFCFSFHVKMTYLVEMTSLEIFLEFNSSNLA